MSATLPITSNDRVVIRIATIAAQRDFTFDFPVQYETDLSVEVALAATPDVWAALSFAGGDYSVAGIGAPSGGTVTLTAGRAIGDRLRISGDAEISRTSSVISGGAYRSEAIDADLDRLTIIAQEARRDVDAFEDEYHQVVAIRDEVQADRIATDAARAAAELWATSPDPIPPSAGGDGTTTRSAKTHAERAATSAGNAETAKTAAETALTTLEETIDAAVAGGVAAAIGQSQAWAEGHLPGGAGTKSSKEWSQEAAGLFAGGYTASTIPATTAAGIKALNTATYPVAYRTDAGKEGFYKWDAAVLADTARADAAEYLYISPNLAVAGAYVRVAMATAEKTALNRALNERPFEEWPVLRHTTERGVRQRPELDLGRPYNLCSNSEDPTDVHYAKDFASVGTDTMYYEGVKLTRVTTTNYWSGGLRQLPASDLALTAGKRYIISGFIAAPFDRIDTNGIPAPCRFVGHWLPANGSTWGHGRKLVGPTPRRIWSVVHALTATTFDVMADPTVAFGSGAAANLYHFVNSAGVGGTTIPADLFAGGFQIEEAPNQSERPAIGVIGTSIDTTTSSLKHPASERGHPRYLEGLLNIPIFNLSIGGQTSSQILARWDTDIAPVLQNCKYVFLMMNVNDFAEGFSSSLYRANWADMYNRSVTAGCIPIVGTIQRRSSFNYAAGPSDLAAEIDYIKATYPNVIDRDQVMADCIDGGLLNTVYDLDHIHQIVAGNRAFAFMIAHKYGHLFQFDNVPRPYQPWLRDDSQAPDVAGALYYEAVKCATFDAASTATNLRDDIRARAPVIVFNGAPGGAKTFQLSHSSYRTGAQPAGTVKAWTIWNAVTDGSILSIQLYKLVSGVATAYGAAIPIEPGKCREIITDGSSVIVKGGYQLTASATVDPPSLAAGAYSSISTITVSGAALGDRVRATFSVNLAGVELFGWISGPNTFSYWWHNTTAGTIDLASGTLNVWVDK